MKVDDGVAVFQGKRRESGGGVVPGGGGEFFINHPLDSRPPIFLIESYRIIQRQMTDGRVTPPPASPPISSARTTLVEARVSSHVIQLQIPAVTLSRAGRIETGHWKGSCKLIYLGVGERDKCHVPPIHLRSR